MILDEHFLVVGVWFFWGGPWPGNGAKTITFAFDLKGVTETLFPIHAHRPCGATIGGRASWVCISSCGMRRRNDASVVRLDLRINFRPWGGAVL